MSKTKEQLIDEAYQNVQEDRARLKGALAKVEQAAELDPTLLPTAAKTAVVVTECMIKANAQLVELIKVEAKSAPEPNAGDGPFTETEASGMWDEIDRPQRAEAPDDTSSKPDDEGKN